VKAPRCGVHVSTEMELRSVPAPVWLIHPDGTDGEVTMHAGRLKKKWERKFWKCPIAGCWRVAPYAMSDAEVQERRKPCAKCGGPVEGDTMEIRNRNARCRACHNARCRACHNARAKERDRAQRASLIDDEALDAEAIATFDGTPYWEQREAKRQKRQHSFAVARSTGEIRPVTEVIQ
jgi:hypothetical protein